MGGGVGGGGGGGGVGGVEGKGKVVGQWLLMTSA